MHQLLKNFWLFYCCLRQEFKLLLDTPKPMFPYRDVDTKIFSYSYIYICGDTEKKLNCSNFASSWLGN